MADSLDGFTYGRDLDGINKIRDEFKERFRVIKDDLTIDEAVSDNDKRTTLRSNRSAAMSELLKTIDQNWQGEDKDAYMRLISDKTEDMIYKLDKYADDIDQALLDCYDEFVNFQDQTSSKIGH